MSIIWLIWHHIQTSFIIYLNLHSITYYGQRNKDWNIVDNFPKYALSKWHTFDLKVISDKYPKVLELKKYKCFPSEKYCIFRFS